MGRESIAREFNIMTTSRQVGSRGEGGSRDAEESCGNMGAPATSSRIISASAVKFATVF